MRVNASIMEYFRLTVLLCLTLFLSASACAGGLPEVQTTTNPAPSVVSGGVGPSLCVGYEIDRYGVWYPPASYGGLRVDPYHSSACGMYWDRLTNDSSGTMYVKVCPPPSLYNVVCQIVNLKPGELIEIQSDDSSGGVSITWGPVGGATQTGNFPWRT